MTINYQIQLIYLPCSTTKEPQNVRGFEQLLQKFGITAADVCKATGIRQSTISNWKSRRNLISGKNAQLIADYFNISVDYLMSGEEKEGGEKYYLNDETAKMAQEIF
ncbi:MAG: helix-turn-helix domain-containing protein [Roseburia intestinalis]